MKTSTSRIPRSNRSSSPRPRQAAPQNPMPDPPAGPCPELAALCNEISFKWLMGKALPLVDYNWHRAEDAVQATFLALLKRKTFNSARARPLTLALWILRNRIYRMNELDFIHNRQLQRYVERLRLSADVADSDSPIDREERERIQAAICQLPPEIQFALRRFERGDTLEQTAQRIGVTNQTVHRRSSEGLRRLRTILGCK